MADKKRLAILGSTGSVGTSTLDVVARHPERFEVVALAARHQAAALYEQCLAFRPRVVVLLESAAARDLQRRLLQAGLGCEVLSGAGALERVASLPDIDTVMAAIVGVAGLRPTLAAARAGKNILLANKESLVSAGAVLM
ncbi:MAG TPA: 1-deoxy-D-xylulose-5-phosphate reductoisomerase, partial [Burkholderiales bacterium]|nr:1-deoxy-D-xylulose-5-phosphate reductoisomerase [Burkholderiales bacterium]